MKKLLYALLPLALAACQERPATLPPHQLAFNNFDQIAGWTNGVPPSPSLTQEHAHSGLYSVKVDSVTQYSIGFNDQLGHISNSRIGRLRIHGWVLVPNDRAEVLLVTELTNPGEPKALVWDGFNVLKAAKAKSAINRWLEIDYTLTLPKSSNYLSVLRVYLWRAYSKQPAYLDDLQLSRAD